MRSNRQPAATDNEAQSGPLQQTALGQPIDGARGRTSTLYLVGLWDSIRFDPSVWGFRFKMGLLQYQVEGATSRLLNGSVAACRAGS